MWFKHTVYWDASSLRWNFSQGQCYQSSLIWQYVSEHSQLCIDRAVLFSITSFLFNVPFFLQGDPVSPDTSHASCRSTGRHLATIRISCFHTPPGARSLKIPSILFNLVYSFHGLQIIVWFKITVFQEKKYFKSPWCISFYF